MKNNFHFSVFLLVLAIANCFIRLNHAQTLATRSSGTLSSVRGAVPSGTGSELPLFAMRRFSNDYLVVVYEKLVKGQVDLAVSLFSQQNGNQVTSTIIESNILLQDVAVVIQKGKVIVVARTFPNEFKIYYLDVSEKSISKQKVVSVKPIQWGENLSFYPKFGVDILEGKIWICLADAVDSAKFNSDGLPVPPLPSQSRVILHWLFLSGDKMWKVGSHTLKFKPEIGSPVSICWSPNQGLLTAFGRQILVYSISKKQVSEFKSLLSTEGTYWSCISINKYRKNFFMLIKYNKISSLYLIDARRGKIIDSIGLPKEVPIKSSIINIDASKGKYLLSYLPYESRLMRNAGSHGASALYYRYKGIKWIEIYVK